MSLTKHIGMVVLALLIALPLSAQTTLSGMVRDESGKALGNVMVRAYNQHKKLKLRPIGCTFSVKYNF